MFPVFTRVDGTDRLLIAITFIYLLFMLKNNFQISVSKLCYGKRKPGERYRQHQTTLTLANSVNVVAPDFHIWGLIFWSCDRKLEYGVLLFNLS